MLDIDFGQHQGGRRTFVSVAKLLGDAKAEAERWASWLPKETKGRANSPLRTLSEAWRSLIAAESQARELGHAPPNIEDAIVSRAHQSNNLVEFDSATGLALREIYSEHGLNAAEWAHRTVFNKQDSRLFNNIELISPSALNGIIAIDRKLAGFDTGKAATMRQAIRKQKDKLEAEVAENSVRMHALEERYESVLAALDVRRVESEAAFLAGEENRSIDANNQREKFDGEWKDLYNAYSEQLKIESAVTLWKKRSEDFRAAAGRSRNWLIGVGIIGLMISVGWSIGAFELGGYLFQSALIQPKNPKLAADVGLRPTFHFELIFASAGMLLYLTMYLWTMRFLVRNHLTEQHLAIDAAGRASMAETYLALTKENAATDADRAIVLSSLFRPVVDGMVKDDGPPAITPAAILAGLVQSKS